MSSWPTHPRREPYTEAGIKRLQCVRCGCRAAHQWNICAEGNNYRPICLACDVELNEMVLSWTGHPKARELSESYRHKQEMVK